MEGDMQHEEVMELFNPPPTTTTLHGTCVSVEHSVFRASLYQLSLLSPALAFPRHESLGKSFSLLSLNFPICKMK